MASDHAALVYRWRLEVDGVVYHYAGSTIVGEKTWKKHKADVLQATTGRRRPPQRAPPSHATACGANKRPFE